MTDLTPTQQIADGLETQDTGTQRRARRIAADFAPNADYERLLQMRDAGDPRWHHVGHGKQLSVAMYADQKTTAATVEGTA